MKHWRVTKYNPTFRESSGSYGKDDWTSFDDIGRAFDGVVLTAMEYQRTEDCYVDVAVHFAQEAGVSELVAVDVEERRMLGVHLAEGESIRIKDLSSVIRPVLRSQVWCKLEYRPIFYLHFGYDYYMYIGSQLDLPESIQFAIASGLFVEDEVSPYLEWD